MADSLTFGSLPPSTRHLCIDMQQLFAPTGPWPTPWMERVLDTVVALTDRDPARTIFTRFIPPAHADEMPGAWRRYYTVWRDKTRTELDPALLDLVPALRSYTPPAQVFDRPVYSALGGRRLNAHLAADGVDTLVVSGAETDVCVLSTVLSAVDLGYRIVIAADAICSSSDPGHDALLTMYRQRFTQQIEIAGTAEIIAAWPSGR